MKYSGNIAINLFLVNVFSLQAIHPLKGKILNFERKDDTSMYKNQEIQFDTGFGTWSKGKLKI